MTPAHVSGKVASVKETEIPSSHRRRKQAERLHAVTRTEPHSGDFFEPQTLSFALIIIELAFKVEAAAQEQGTEMATSYHHAPRI
jgi:hypothetical protein